MNYAKIMENGTVRISSIKKRAISRSKRKNQRDLATLSLLAIQRQKKM